MVSWATCLGNIHYTLSENAWILHITSSRGDESKYTKCIRRRWRRRSVGGAGAVNLLQYLSIYNLDLTIQAWSELAFTLICYNMHRLFRAINNSNFFCELAKYTVGLLMMIHSGAFQEICMFFLAGANNIGKSETIEDIGKQSSKPFRLIFLVKRVLSLLPIFFKVFGLNFL